MRREYQGAAAPSTLTFALGGTSTDLTIQCADLTNWPTGVASRPFYIVIDRDTASEEKILCASRSGNTITVYSKGLINGRGADDTSITSHSVDAVIEHVFTATDADEANAHVNDSTTNVHPQYALLTKPINNKTDSYALALADAGDVVEIIAATPKNLTIPPDGGVNFPVGSTVTVVSGAGTVVLVAASGVTLNSALATTIPAWGARTLIKRAANNWVAF